jgi:hypothetical protein
MVGVAACRWRRAGDASTPLSPALRTAVTAPHLRHTRCQERTLELTGERRLPAAREKIWQALNDPATLRASIPGCRALDPVGDAGFKATVAVKVGPISSVFTGEVRLSDLDPPRSYRIEGSGQGGPAGVAKGGATVILTQDGAETVLGYTVKAEVGGKLAQLGARLIDATAKQLAEQFFDNFAAAVIEPAAAPGEEPVAASPRPPAPLDLLASIPRAPLGYPLIGWIVAALFLFIALNLIAPYFTGH